MRSQCGEHACCRVISELIDRPLEQCHTNDYACESCLKTGVAPQVPNAVVAVLSIRAAQRSGDGALAQSAFTRFASFMNLQPLPPTTCVLRGPEIRKVDCKPCQADSLVPVPVPVFRCPKHQECTLHNTGTFPKIQACVSCGVRLEKYVQLDVKPAAPEALAAIHALSPHTFHPGKHQPG